MLGHPYAVLRTLFWRSLLEQEHIAGQYYCEMEKSMLRNFDKVITDERYPAIVQAIGDKTDMERLDTLIAERLLRVKPMDVFLQIYHRFPSLPGYSDRPHHSATSAGPGGRVGKRT